MPIKSVIYILSVTFIVAIFSIVLGLPTLLNLDWITTINTSIKLFLISHIEVTLTTVLIAFIILLCFKHTDNIYDFFDTHKYSEALIKKLENARSEYSEDYKLTFEKTLNLHDEIHSEKRKMEGLVEKTINKVRLLENDLSYKYRDTFRYTSLISASIIEIATHTNLEQCGDFEKISKEYQKSIEFTTQYIC